MDLADNEQAAQHLLERLNAFVESLDEVERALLAALIAPGVMAAYADGSSEVDAFGMVPWSVAHLPAALARAIRRNGLRIERR